MVVQIPGAFPFHWCFRFQVLHAGASTVYKQLGRNLVIKGLGAGLSASTLGYLTLLARGYDNEIRDLVPTHREPEADPYVSPQLPPLADYLVERENIPINEIRVCDVRELGIYVANNGLNDTNVHGHVRGYVLG